MVEGGVDEGFRFVADIYDVKGDVVGSCVHEILVLGGGSAILEALSE